MTNIIDDPFADNEALSFALNQASFFISEAALKKLASFKEIHDGQLFRIKVHGGGCAGYRFDFSFCEDFNDDDRVFRQENIQIVLDINSLKMLNGSQLDYAQELIGAYLTIKNPSAKTSCGCGMSFSL